MGDGLLPISNPHGSKNWDLIEPYAKVPAGAGAGGVLGLTDGARCRLEEAERELAVPRDELVADGKHLAFSEGIACRCRRAAARSVREKHKNFYLEERHGEEYE